ncbi:MAG TPA: universal stress protein [Draconibacterium sp.]|nr:universal stress protein [Draconibacterium sp.]
MYKLNHILVCLDLSEMDDFLIRYTQFLAEKIHPESITFLHVMRSYEIPKEIVAAFPHLEEPIKDIVQEELQKKVNELIKPINGVNLKTKVIEGFPTETIVKFTQKNDITLTLMGKKMGYEGQGSIVRKVLGIIPSSVLLISETANRKIKNIMVRMDFSKISGMALKMALRLQELTGAEVSCHHVHKLPLNYFPQNQPEEDKRLLKHIEKHSIKEYQKFIKSLKLNDKEIPLSFSLDVENEEHQILYNRALTIGADIILIGSKIKSELADIIIDSTSEKLASSEKNIPVFIVKDRNQIMGFLKALLPIK